MKIRHGVLALLLSATCVNQPDEATESAKSALGVLPPTESATWSRVGFSNLPDGRYAHALAFDETRQVVVVFGGMTSSPDGSTTAQQDTWEWDPATGAWTDKSGSGTKPSARSQHSMIFDSKAGKILLFGGGRSTINGDIMTVGLAFDDTWEYDGATATWSKLATDSAPSARIDFGFAYSSQTNKAYLFGGMEITTAGVDGTPVQDSWEWDGAAGTWTERTGPGDKPSPRFAHAMAIDSSKGQAVIFGGYDMISGGSLNDVWYWNLVSGTWTGTQASVGVTWPSQRQWSSLAFSTSTSRLYLVAGLVNDQSGYGGMGGGYGGVGGMTGAPICFPGSPYCSSSSSGATREVWELNTATTTWVDRSAPSNSPGPRSSHAMAADPVTGKVYVFGGQDDTGTARDDLWEWNGDKWVECSADVKPPARYDTGLAYDPARKSLILFGGSSGTYTYYGTTDVLADTWEWNTGTRKWTQLFPTLSPSQRSGHGMVTDSARKRIILYAGYDSSGNIIVYPPYYYPDAGAYSDPSKTDVWEWDGASGTWTNRTPTLLVSMPTGGSYPIMVFDDGREKLALFDALSNYYGYGYGSSAAGDFWEWDPVGGAWSQKVTGEALGQGLYDALVSYDSIRRRVVLLGRPAMTDSTASMSTWELDTSGPTWYARPPSGEPVDSPYAAMAFDNQRGVVVLFGGMPWGTATDETWEYSVTSRGNGTGCAAATASLCASGNCVDGVCCESASCSGPCKSCNVPGKAGTCVLASPGTQVAGSCSGDQACDATGACKTADGKACTSATACASGFCSDGVCCNSACTGTCVSCKLAGTVGTCSPIPIGTDPDNDCGKGTPPCQSTCDGVGACVFPMDSSCGKCGTCNYVGSCVEAMYCTLTDTNTRTSSLTSTATTTRSVITATATGTGTIRTSTVTSTGTVLTATRTASSTGTSGTATATNTLITATATSTSTTGTGSATVTRTASATITSSGTGTGTTSSATDTGTGALTSTASETSIGPGPDAGLATATARDGSIGDGGGVRLGHSGCSCDLGSAPAGGPGLESVLGLLGAILVWRRTRKRR
jgi:N-acetylneuraminic acid mutarotase